MRFCIRSRFLSGVIPLFFLPVIIVLFLLLPLCCNSVKNENNERPVNSKVGNDNRPNPSIRGGKMRVDIDIVGYGEDCSSDEGPFCDEGRHLTCDPIDETCVCDVKNGFVHINDVPGGMEQHLLIRRDENGNKYLDLNGNVCISKQEIIERTEELLGLWNNDNPVPIPTEASADSSEDDWNWGHYEGEHYDDDAQTSNALEGGSTNSIYDNFMKNAQGFKQQDYDMERLGRFKLVREPVSREMSEKDLIVAEILKYRRGIASLDEMKPFIKERLNLFLKWRSEVLSNSICSLVFDIDRDTLFTYQEYVISIFSEPVRELTIPNVFLDLIGPLVEESCISKEDLRKLDHNPKSFDADFRTLDVNQDGCFSQEEFRKYLNETCHVNWFSDFLRETDLEIYLVILDPKPEEMYIRRVMQNERLAINWDIMDTDKDGLISVEELHADLSPFALKSTNSLAEAKLLMKHLDKNGDGKVSFNEVKLQISVPTLTEEYQFDWVESMYQLYETDDDEVQEFLEMFKLNQDDKEMREFNGSNIGHDTGNRLFIIFDKNRNGEIDEVEFKLLMEMMKKYVVFGILNETIDSMDLDSDRRLSFFEYQEYFRNASSTFRIYFKNAIALEAAVDEIENGEANPDFDDTEYYNNDEEEEADENSEGSVSSTQLSKRAAVSNETSMIYKLFIRLDENLDGFITKEDFYAISSSYKAKKTDSELKEEFKQQDIDKDGLLTTADSEDYVISIDFEKFKQTADAFSEEIFSNDMKAQFFLLDINHDGAIQNEEFQASKGLLVTPEEEDEFLGWIEVFLGTQAAHYDKAAEKTFSEFDMNCDGFIEEAEFTAKVKDLMQKSKFYNFMAFKEDISVYFKGLDLNKDDKISHHEFQLLLLRTGKRPNER